MSICSTPQLLIDGTTADCGCCDPCRAVRSLADRNIIV